MQSEILIEVVSKTLDTVLGTVGDPWLVKTRLLREMAREIRMSAYSTTSQEDIGVLLTEEFNDIIQNDDIHPKWRLMLADFFAQEVMNWLTGDFDNAAD